VSGAAVARVLVDSPVPQLDRLFDYRVPEAFRGDIRLGIRVRVPLRSAGRIADGYVVELVEQGDYVGVLSDLDGIVSTVPVLAPEVAILARKAADRAAGSAIDIVRVAVPGRQARVEKAWLAERDAQNAAAPPIASPAVEISRVAISRVIIGGYVPGRIEAAVVAGERIAVDAIPLVTELADPANPASEGGAGQQVGQEGGQQLGQWVGHWAVTMAAAAATCMAEGKTAILSVPDYRDQEQLTAALEAVLPADRIVRLDARQTNPDRYRAFLRCLGANNGASNDATGPLAIVGNRSVVYAPAANLGLIAIWDDGDPLHSEPLAPYVHTRDAALLRQEQQGCALLFLSHSRSTEVERLVEVGWVESVSPAPSVLPKVIPTAQQASGDRLAAQARIPSTAWRAAREALEQGPVLVQVARPGYAPRLACVDCGQSARCLRCEGPLAQKSARSIPACAWCGALAVDWHCDNCDGTKMRFVGAGAARTAEDLGRAFPGVKILIADGERHIRSVGADPALVIATRGAEPVAAGGYRAVLLLDGERMAARESLRVAEDCLRWWSNAVALAARGAPTYLVGVGGALASALSTWRHSAFARAELADRRRLRFPPAIRVATITGTLEAVASAVAAVKIPSEDILGPVDTGPGTVRTILRFDYAAGTETAATLRAEIIRSATNRRKNIAAKGARGAAAPGLRVRFDDTEPFVE
jgi:primosomal protein N' (replication factor Y)